MPQQTNVHAMGGGAPSRAGGWPAVLALTLCVSTLIASEFMPVSLLTPIATDLHLTEGQAGQAIAVSGIFAVLTSLFISSATKGVDRRTVLLWMTALMAASGLIVAFATNYALFMTGRALIGVVIGGFWSMSAATVMRLVPERDVTRALATLNGGNAVATTIAAPLGSFLGQYIGWRGAFFCVVPLAAITLVWKFLTLPEMPSRERSGAAAVFKVLLRSQVPYGMLAAGLFFMGQFALFTYLRPFLETVTRVNVTTLSLILLIIGIAGVAGTYLIGLALKRSLYDLLVAMPIGMAVIAVGLVAFGSSPGTVTGLLALWVSRTLPDDAEAGGGLMVAVVQLAITLGASIGGLLFDLSSYRATFTASALLLCASAGVAFLGSRAAAASKPQPVGTNLEPCPAELDRLAA
jgi:predicted MFS family arabinose efflux permease